RRLVHLPEDEHGPLEDPGLLHLEPEVVALARALTDPAERRAPLVLLGDVPDQLLDQDRLADSGSPEEPDLAPLRVGSEQVHDLDAGLEDLLGRREVLNLRRGPVNRPAPRRPPPLPGSPSSSQPALPGSSRASGCRSCPERSRPRCA